MCACVCVCATYYAMVIAVVLHHTRVRAERVARWSASERGGDVTLVIFVAKWISYVTFTYWSRDECFVELPRDVARLERHVSLIRTHARTHTHAHTHIHTHTHTRTNNRTHERNPITHICVYIYVCL